MISKGKIRNLSGLLFAEALLTYKDLDTLADCRKNIVERIAKTEVFKMVERVKKEFFDRDLELKEKCLNYAKANVTKYVFGVVTPRFIPELLAILLIENILKNNVSCETFYKRYKSKISEIRNLLIDTHSKYNDDFIDNSKKMSGRILAELR